MHPTGFASLRSARLRVMRVPLGRRWWGVEVTPAVGVAGRDARPGERWSRWRGRRPNPRST